MQFQYFVYPLEYLDLDIYLFDFQSFWLSCEINTLTKSELRIAAC